MVHVHREHAAYDFLGIKNENWQAAARDLGETALALYMYLASNRNDYEFALSQAAVTNAIGMKKSTYYDQFKKLVQKGYLINSHGNTYEFFEIPQSINRIESSESVVGQDFPNAGKMSPGAVQSNPQKNIEINKEKLPTDNINNTILTHPGKEGFIF